jgi:hypothetical protein
MSINAPHDVQVWMITGSLAADIVQGMLSLQFPDGKTLGIVVFRVQHQGERRYSVTP